MLINCAARLIFAGAKCSLSFFYEGDKIVACFRSFEESKLVNLNRFSNFNSVGQ